MNNDEIRRIALENGFVLKPQADGTENLHQYVYSFAHALLAETNERARLAQETARLKSAVESSLHLIDLLVAAKILIPLPSEERIIGGIRAVLAEYPVTPPQQDK